MPLDPDDILALPFAVLLGIVAVMIIIAANGGNAVWLGDVAAAVAYPLTVIAVLSALALAAYQSVASSGR